MTEKILFRITTHAKDMEWIDADESPVFGGLAGDRNVGMDVCTIDANVAMDEEEFEVLLDKMKQLWKDKETPYVRLVFRGLSDQYLLPIEAVKYLGGINNVMRFYLGYIPPGDNEDM